MRYAILSSILFNPYQSLAMMIAEPIPHIVVHIPTIIPPIYFTCCWSPFDFVVSFFGRRVVGLIVTNVDFWNCGRGCSFGCQSSSALIWFMLFILIIIDIRLHSSKQLSWSERTQWHHNKFVYRRPRRISSGIDGKLVSVLVLRIHERQPCEVRRCYSNNRM